MVKNEMQCDTLGIQHRMRPEIAELIVPHIYKELKNDPSVEKYENVLGVLNNLYFINHDKKEAGSDETKSHSNQHEAEYMIALCGYLLNQGYDESQITILTLYTGQMFALRKLARNAQISVRITPVDNFQGEEDDIILLSLVRSNTSGKIGFLKVSNRVCVSLSRAKKGFFVIGNMDQIAGQSVLWNGIIEMMKKKGRVVEALPLTCQNHPDNRILAKNPKDFDQAPDGGCMRPCDFRLDCGHVCRFKCHPIDQEHEEYECLKPCARRCKTNGENGHLCKKQCYMECGRCTVKVEKIIPRCGHVQKVPCYMEPEQFKCAMPCPEKCTTNGEDGHPCKKTCPEDCGKCMVEVEKIIPKCGHEQVVPCHQDPETFNCKMPCKGMPYICSHRCIKLCSEPCPALCKTMVTKERKRCGHKYQARCFFLSEPTDCPTHVEHILPCGHVLKKKCSDDISSYKCEKKITVKLPCQHEVQIACHRKDNLEEIQCMTKVEKACAVNPLEHKYKVPCSDIFGALFGCKEKCNAELPCGHKCNGTCGDCLGRVHPPCQERCTKVLPCFHLCTGKCGEMCRPCQQQCLSSCPHRTCSRKCGETCDPCAKPCSWNCPHANCTKACYKLCDREPCNQPCPRSLPCGHKCLGYCGEPCPVICFYCNWPQFAVLENILKRKFTEQTRFVQVFPCYHIVESRYLEDWFKASDAQEKSHTYTLLICPICKRQVTGCPRFGNMIKKNAAAREQIKAKITTGDRESNLEQEQIKRILESLCGAGPIRSHQFGDNRNSMFPELKWFGDRKVLLDLLVQKLIGFISRSQGVTDIDSVMKFHALVICIAMMRSEIDCKSLSSREDLQRYMQKVANLLMKGDRCMNLEVLRTTMELAKGCKMTNAIEWMTRRQCSWIVCPKGKNHSVLLCVIQCY